MDPNLSACVRSEFLAIELRELLQKPPTALIGVGPAADEALRTLSIRSIFDLALSQVFDVAHRIEQASTGSGDLARYGVVPAEWVDTAILASTPIDRLPSSPISALVRIGPGNAPALRDALHVEEIRDLALWPPYLNARRIVARVLQPAGDTLDPEAPAEFVPKAGEFATERVRYQIHLLSEVDGGKLTKLETALPLSLVDATKPLTKPAVGAMLDYSQSWYPLGLSLGHLLYSLPLAPGESTKIAVIDFRRRIASALQEDIGQTESLSNSLVQSRSISEIVTSVADETQSGKSLVKTSSDTSSEAMGGGYLMGPSLGITSLADQKARTKGRTRGVFSSQGRREIAASMQQHIAAATHQKAFASRNRHAAVVSEAAAEEREQVSTRTVTNYNHMHALTVQYYEVVQIYRTELRLEACQRLLFIPLKIFDFNDERIVLRHRSTLLVAALDPYIRNLLLAAGGGVEASLRLPRFPPPMPLDASTPDFKKEALKEAKRHAKEIAKARAKLKIGFIVAQRRGGLLDFDSTDLTSWIFAAGAELIDIGWSTDDSTALQTVTVHLESSTELQVADNGHGRTSAAPNPDLGAAIAIGSIDRITLEFEEEDVPRAQKFHLRLRLPTGAIFSVPCNCVLPADRSSATLLSLSAPASSAELGALLQENALYYSQQIWLDIDPHELTIALADMEYRGKRVIEYIDPTPVTVAGNSLAFLWRDEDDSAWHKWKEEHAHATPKHDLVPVPTGGVFAEAVLGRFNSAEKIDISRFWNWQDSPIPVQAPDIAAIQTGQRDGTETVRAGTLDQPVVNIVNPPGLPDPQGLSASLAALTASNMFRDMSGAAQVAAFGQAALQAASQAAIAAGTQAGANMATAAEFFVETAKQLLPLVAGGLGIPVAAAPGTSNITNAAGLINTGAKIDTATGQEGGQAPNPPLTNANTDDSLENTNSRQIEAFRAALGGRSGVVFASNNRLSTTPANSTTTISQVPGSTPQSAIAAIVAFRARSGPCRFTLHGDMAVARAKVADRLEQLAANPRDLHQKNLSACGMAAFLHIWLKRDPLAAVMYAIDLFEQGQAKIGTLPIVPSTDLLRENYQLVFIQDDGAGDNVPDEATWMMMSALRDATRTTGRFLGRAANLVEGVVLPEEFMGWLKATGLYFDVLNKANFFLQRPFSDSLSLFPDANRDIAMLMHTRMLPGTLPFAQAVAALATPNHYVVMDSPIEVVSGSKVRFKVWCWGDQLSTPLEIDRTKFEQNFYGAVLGLK